MARGTPVVALRRGSVPEVVRHGRTGFVCDDEAGLPAALAATDLIDPAACVAHVATAFSAVLMARRYEALYRAVLGRPAAVTAVPHAVPVRAHPAR
jgi:glycosyltransferase involved in cell wall biosynthesis